jgi:hypothetical protein
MPSNKELLFIDFTNPKVKCTLSADYEDLYDASTGKNMQEQFEALFTKRDELLNDPNLEWAKIASIQGKLLFKIHRR